MGQAALLEFVAQLVRQAETACAEDAVMQEAAGMVYVGDVYALLLTRAGGGGPPADAARDDAVWPFIR